MNASEQTVPLGETRLPSYVGGISAQPLLGDTIGANLDRTAARVGDHEALVECATGRRFSYAELVAEVDACALGLRRARVCARATGSASGRRTARSGCSSSTARRSSARSWSTSTRRTGPTSCAYVLKQAGISVLVSAPEFKTSDYRAMVGRGARRVPRPARGDLPRRPERGSGCWPAGRAADRGAAGRAREPSCRPTTRSTSSTRRARRASRRARRSPTTTCSTTGSSSARAAATPRPTGSASRCPTTTASAWGWATSATSHGATMVIPAPGLRPRR